MNKIDRKILNKIMEKTSLGEQSVRNAVSKLKNNKCPRATSNAAAQLFAQSKGFSVAKMLKKEDKETLPLNIEFEKPFKIKKTGKKFQKRKILEIIQFETSEYFLKKHIEEVNRAYTFGCYTSAYILCRKIIENLLINILRRKYPNKIKNHKELYFDLQRGRFLDLKYVLKNLSLKAKDFGSEEEIIKRLVNKAGEFKDDANNKTHSLYHIVTNKKELEDKNPQEILALISSLTNYATLSRNSP